MHPLLTQEDQKILDSESQIYKEEQVKYGLGWTLTTIALGTLLFRKSTTFQKVFNNRNSYRVNNWVRRVFGFYGVFVAWLMSLNPHY